MKQIAPYIHRDISWLDFNYRVLQEAKDPNVPLFDRLKFLAIYSSNLDEFFRVRVANNRNLIRIGKKTRKNLGFEPADLLTGLLKKVNKQQLETTKLSNSCSKLFILWLVGLEIFISDIIQYRCRLYCWSKTKNRRKSNQKKNFTLDKYFS